MLSAWMIQLPLSPTAHPLQPWDASEEDGNCTHRPLLEA